MAEKATIIQGASAVMDRPPGHFGDWARDAYGFEVSVDSAQSAINALQGGAWQLQLCKGLSINGLTPNFGLLKFLRRISPDVHTSVVIRPRTGDFVYTGMEHDLMLSDVVDVYRCGANDVVVGYLTEENDIDMLKCRELMSCAKTMSVTFSHAFDLTRNPRESLDRLMDLGFNRVLTSGCRPNCEEGARFMRELMDQAAGRIAIVPTGAINPENLDTILQITGTSQVTVTASGTKHPSVTSYGHGVGKCFGPIHEECCVVKVGELLSIARRHWGI